MSVYIPVSLRNQIRELDRNRCRYCQTRETLSGIPMTLDHIHPLSKGGVTSFENVCLACRACNEFKGDCVTVQDLLTQEIVPLFNPRTKNGMITFLGVMMEPELKAKLAWGELQFLLCR